MSRARSAFRPDAVGRNAGHSASLDATGHVTGTLSFATVVNLLPVGAGLIESGAASIIDLAQVEASDSAGLALLLEWLSIARAAGRTLRYENIPRPLLQLARLSDVEQLLQQGV